MKKKKSFRDKSTEANREYWAFVDKTSKQNKGLPSWLIHKAKQKKTGLEG